MMTGNGAREVIGSAQGVLIATKQYLLDGGWAQPGAYGGERGFDPAQRHDRVGENVYDVIVQRVFGIHSATKRAIELLCESAGVPNSRELTAWCDARGRTLSDVIAAIDLAIERAECTR